MTWICHTRCDRFHCKCYTPEIHQIAIPKFLGTNSNSTKFSIWICTLRYRGIWVARFGGFRGCSIFIGNCLYRKSYEKPRFTTWDIYIAKICISMLWYSKTKPHERPRVIHKGPSRWMSHGTYTWMSHGSDKNESWDTYEWVMAPIWMSHGTHMNESWHPYEWVMAPIWMSHGTHMNEWCDTY